MKREIIYDTLKQVPLMVGCESIVDQTKQTDAAAKNES